MRQFLKVAVSMPEGPSFPFIGTTEMAGCVIFDLLGQAGCELFADEPEVAERIRLLYGEILTDEIGHVGYCAARCSNAGRTIMRSLYAPLTRLLVRQNPEINLVIDQEVMADRLSKPFDLVGLSERLTTRPFIAAHP